MNSKRVTEWIWKFTWQRLGLSVYDVLTRVCPGVTSCVHLWSCLVLVSRMGRRLTLASTQKLGLSSICCHKVTSFPTASIQLVDLPECFPEPRLSLTPPRKSWCPSLSWSQTANSKDLSAKSSILRSSQDRVWSHLGLVVFRQTPVFCFPLGWFGNK